MEPAAVTAPSTPPTSVPVTPPLAVLALAQASKMMSERMEAILDKIEKENAAKAE